MDKLKLKMANVLSKLRPENSESFDEYLFEMNMTELRKKIAKFIIKEREDGFFDMAKFYMDNKIEDKEKYIKEIAVELKELGWLVGLVFNKTGIVLFKNKGESEKSFWSNNIDFEIL